MSGIRSYVSELDNMYRELERLKHRLSQVEWQIRRLDKDDAKLPNLQKEYKELKGTLHDVKKRIAFLNKKLRDFKSSHDKERRKLEKAIAACGATAVSPSTPQKERDKAAAKAREHMDALRKVKDELKLLKW
jgi:chromosome segregation ATPase